MTDEQRHRAELCLRSLIIHKSAWVHETDAAAIEAYCAEHERMRQFIRNLADESRVYLESEE